ncbi:MAG: hypothetical protein ACOC44_15005 [Promethearchaeia archaeon]
MSENEEKEADPKEEFAKNFMEAEELKGRSTKNKILEIIKEVGLNEEKVKEKFLQFKAKEDFANQVMEEVGLKGKVKRLKVMKIMDKIGWNKKKIKTALQRSSIASRIDHE